MKYAIRFSIILLGVTPAIILLFYYYSDFLSSKFFAEIFTILVYVIIISIFIIKKFQKTIAKNKIRLRLKKYNWIYLIILLIPGLLKIHDGYMGTDVDKVLFGFINKDYAQGFGYILFGVVFLNRTILINKKGIKLNDLFYTEFDYSQFNSISFTKQSVQLQADSQEFNYKIKELSEHEITDIYRMIEEFRSGTIV
jgi:hypothetical protein